MKITNDLEALACRIFGTSRPLIVEDDLELRRSHPTELQTAKTRWRKERPAERNLVQALDEDSIPPDSYEKLSRYDKGLVRRWAEYQVKRAEWLLRRNKFYVFADLAFATLLVLTVGIVLVLASLSGGMQISVVMACSAIVAALLRHFRNSIDRP